MNAAIYLIASKLSHAIRPIDPNLSGLCALAVWPFVLLRLASFVDQLAGSVLWISA